MRIDAGNKLAGNKGVAEGVLPIAFAELLFQPGEPAFHGGGGPRSSTSIQEDSPVAHPPLNNPYGTFRRKIEGSGTPSLGFVAGNDAPAPFQIDMAIFQSLRFLRAAADIPTEQKQVADARNLRLAWDYLAHNGGQAAGPNGRHFADFERQETWDYVRVIGKAIQYGTYRPGPVRHKSIPKGTGRGNRTLTIANIEDRVVSRAVAQIIQPIYDPTFDDRSFGFRPRQQPSTWTAY